MGYAKVLLSLLLAFALAATTTKSEFTCTTTNATCKALIDYVLPNTTTLSAIQTLFQVEKLHDILGANSNLPTSTSPNLTIAAGQRVKIPFPCTCSNGTGVSNRTPNYTVVKDYGLYHIAAEVFMNLVTYPEITKVNGIADVNMIEVGQELWIPLPCSCDDVDGVKVVHYGHVVEAGNTLVKIAEEYGTTEATLLKLNKMANASQLLADQVLDVPLKGSSSENNGSTSLGILPTPTGQKQNWKIIARGIAVGVAGITVICCVIYCFLKREQLSSKVTVCLKIDDLNAEEILKNYESLAPKRYIYSDVKKLTNSFTDKVGQGGYGAVYKGKLPDGRLLAVKVLSESKGNGDEFTNEVASICRTSHVNVVSLLGFCYEKTKRALIYEFMANGSLDKFIYNTNSRLEWKTMYEIALGIARGLEYLHRGCSTRILHLDIKPHNILLDEDLCPKISDFGLAKLCKIKESIVSMTGMRGTIGYIAPEVYNRSFGGVSHKSDVYSYGMLVLEMVGGRKIFDYGASHTSEIYFPHWIYKKLELGENVSTYEQIIEEEEDTAKKMITVSLWCVQTNPSDRPSMGKVIEMLEGTLESLQFPPKPFLDSPTRSPPQHSSSQ